MYYDEIDQYVDRFYRERDEGGSPAPAQRHWQQPGRYEDDEGSSWLQYVAIAVVIAGVILCRWAS